MGRSQQYRMYYIQKKIEIHYGYEDVNQRKLKVKQSPSTLKDVRNVSLPIKPGENARRK